MKDLMLRLLPRQMNARQSKRLRRSYHHAARQSARAEVAAIHTDRLAEEFGGSILGIDTFVSFLDFGEEW